MRVRRKRKNNEGETKTMLRMPGGEKLALVLQRPVQRVRHVGDRKY